MATVLSSNNSNKRYTKMHAYAKQRENRYDVNAELNYNELNGPTMENFDEKAIRARK